MRQNVKKHKYCIVVDHAASIFVASCPIIDLFNISFLPIRNVDMNEIRKIFPKADRKIIPGASHFVHTDKPKEFQELVHKFLTG